jgi:hypothetical protein
MNEVVNDVPQSEWSGFQLRRAFASMNEGPRGMLEEVVKVVEWIVE